LLFAFLKYYFPYFCGFFCFIVIFKRSRDIRYINLIVYLLFDNTQQIIKIMDVPKNESEIFVTSPLLSNESASSNGFVETVDN